MHVCCFWQQINFQSTFLMFRLYVAYVWRACVYVKSFKKACIYAFATNWFQWKTFSCMFALFCWIRWQWKPNFFPKKTYEFPVNTIQDSSFLHKLFSAKTHSKYHPTVNRKPYFWKMFLCERIDPPTFTTDEPYILKYKVPRANQTTCYSWLQPSTCAYFFRYPSPPS